MELTERGVSEILESITDGFLALDRGGRFTYVNHQAEQMIGQPRRTLMGRHLWDVFPQFKESRIEREYDYAVEHHLPVEFEEVVPERQAWLEIRAYPNSDGMSIYFRDVTKRKLAEQAQAMLVAMVSHDLRNPLFLVKGTVELLRQQLASGGSTSLERIAQDLQRVERAANHMDRVVDDLMDLVQLQNGQQLKLETAPTDLVALVKRVVDAYAFRTDAHRLEIRSQVMRLVGDCDERRIERVLGNLLDNAIKYSAGGGDIVVSIAREDRLGVPWAVLSIADAGIGIEDDDLPHIFERFYRGQAIAGVIPGSGVGLAGVRYSVERHGGHVEVDSQPGEGATFTVYLPLAPCQAATGVTSGRSSSTIGRSASFSTSST